MQNRTSIASACSVGCARTQRIGVTRLGSKRCTFSDLGNGKVRTLHQLMRKRHHGNRDIPSTKLVLAICNHSLVTRPVSSSVASYLLPLLGEVWRHQKHNFLHFLPLKLWCHCWACHRKKNTMIKTTLLGGWTTPFEKYARQIGKSSPIFGVKMKKKIETTNQMMKIIQCSESRPTFGASSVSQVWPLNKTPQSFWSLSRLLKRTMWPIGSQERQHETNVLLPETEKKYTKIQPGTTGDGHLECIKPCK